MVSIMAEMYVRLILQGKRFYEEVPKEVKEQVKELLVNMNREDLLEV